MRSVLFAALLVALYAPVANGEETAPAVGLRDNTPAYYALVGARLVTEPGRIIENGVLVVRGETIEAILQDEAPPANARVIDVAGKTIFAGFFDSYSTIETDGEIAQPGYWNKQVTPQYRVADSLSVDKDANTALRRQGFVARLIAPESGVIKGQSALVTTAETSTTESLLDATVAQHMRLTTSWRQRDGGYPNSPMGAVAVARQAMCDSQWYVAAHAAAKADSSLKRPEMNVALDQLSQYLPGTLPVMVDVSNEQFAIRADRFAREFGLKMLMVGSGREYRLADEIAATHRTVVLPVDFPKPPELNSPDAVESASLSDLMHWHFAPENAARLAKAGVPILLTTDGLKSVDAFLPNVRKAIARGWDARAALASLTTLPASEYGVADRFGTLSPGKSASFVVASGDLFADKKAKVEATWVDGREYRIKQTPLAKLHGDWELKLSGPFAGSRRWNLEVAPDGKKASLWRMVVKQIEVDKPRKEKQKPKREKVRESISIDSLSLEGFELTGLVSDPNETDAVKVPISLTWIFDDEGATLAGTIAPIGGQAMSVAGVALDDARDEPANTKEKDADSLGDEEPDSNIEAAATVELNYPLGAYGATKALKAEIVAFTNATIWTGADPAVVENGTLVVADGKIVGVGSDIEVPKNAKVINCKGKHTTAGIIDCHSHIASDSGINESGQAITAEVRIGDMIDATDIDIYRQLAGGVTTINILHGSANPIGGQNQVIKMRWGLASDELRFKSAPAGIKFALGENVKQSNWGERYTTRYPQTRMGVDEIMISEFSAAQEYAQRWSDWQTNHKGLPPRRDLELEAVAEILAKRRWIHCHSYRQSEIIALLRTLEKYDVQIGTLQHILEGYKVTPEMAKHGAMASSFADWWAYKFEVYDAIPHNGALMHEGGVVVSFNSDDAELGRHLNHEAAKAVKYGGVTPGEAWKFVTLNPARQLRIDQYVGSLEVGKDADVVIWSGEPMSTLSICEQTWIDGRCYFSLETDRELRARDAKWKAELVAAVLRSGESAAKPGENRDDEAKLWPRRDEYCAAHDHTHTHSSKSN